MAELVAVEGKTFAEGETVWIDGKHFIRCTFAGSVLGYAAKGDFRFTDCMVKVGGVTLEGLASSTVDFLLRCGLTDLLQITDMPVDSFNSH